MVGETNILKWFNLQNTTSAAISQSESKGNMIDVSKIMSLSMYSANGGYQALI